jgi:glucose-1-phosphate adenylyltransferase
LFSNVRVNSYCRIEDAVILPNVEIGRAARLRRVVVDKGTRIPPGFEAGFDCEADRRRFFVSADGISVITPEMVAAEAARL